MEVAARSKGATFKLSCQTQAKRKKHRLTPIAFPHGNEPFNCKQNRFAHPRVPSTTTTTPSPTTTTQQLQLQKQQLQQQLLLPLPLLRRRLQELQLQLQLQLQLPLRYTTLQLHTTTKSTTTTTQLRYCYNYNYNYTRLQHATTTLHYTTLYPAVVHCNHSKKHNSNHLSGHQWIRSAIHPSQQLTSPIVSHL